MCLGKYNQFYIVFSAAGSNSIFLDGFCSLKMNGLKMVRCMTTQMHSCKPYREVFTYLNGFSICFGSKDSRSCDTLNLDQSKALCVLEIAIIFLCFLRFQFFFFLAKSCSRKECRLIKIMAN